MLLPLLLCNVPVSRLFFPPVDKNGDVCISILHEPGEDKYGYEKPEERWLPIHTVETIMISVISMLADPNSDSPANVDAAVSSSKLETCQKRGFPLVVLLVVAPCCMEASVQLLQRKYLMDKTQSSSSDGIKKVFLNITQLNAEREDVFVALKMSSGSIISELFHL